MKSVTLLAAASFAFLLGVLPTNAILTAPKKDVIAPSTKNDQKSGLPFSSKTNIGKHQTPNKAAQQQQQRKKLQRQKEEVVDYGSIGKYVGAISVQVASLYLLWSGIDWMFQRFNGRAIPSRRWISFLLIYALNIQAGKFFPLQNIPEQRDPSEFQSTHVKRIQPSWTPPGYVFVLMWPLFVFGTRAYVMATIAEKVGHYANPVTLSMMIHFGFGSLWNHVSRVERRLGVSMLMLYGLVITKAITSYVAYRIDPTAGIVLALTLTWISAAATLGTCVWKLNPEDPKTGKLQPLYPVKKKKISAN